MVGAPSHTVRASGRTEGGRKLESSGVMPSVLGSNFATIIDSDFQANKFITNASDTPTVVLMGSFYPSPMALTP